ncbi:MAG TPA: tRNA (guanosine(37)-N1)-methyltransferase TrmD [Armatimonadota bacterium]|nr:tRNA (guanosine(37)-N1)-methyltransferase TrmD [Armatimonadota bacterium]
MSMDAPATTVQDQGSNDPLRVDVITLLPQVFDAYWSESILGRAQQAGHIQCCAHQVRDFTHDKHHITDDYPYGGGVGMVMKPEPIFEAVESVREGGSREVIIVMAPTGERFSQAMAEELATNYDHLIFVCGRYEAMDERVHAHLAQREISIGDYILTGGEIPALAVIDAVARLIPGVLGGEGAAESESFVTGLLEYPQYTRPPVFREWAIPEVLLSGHHEAIRKWRREQSLRRTLERRPDLLQTAPLTQEDVRLLDRIEVERRQKENTVDLSAGNHTNEESELRSDPGTGTGTGKS